MSTEPPQQATSVEISHFPEPPHQRERRRPRGLVLTPMRQRVAALVLLAIAVFVFVALTRPLRPLRLAAAPLPDAFPGQFAGLAWPVSGEAAVGLQGVGMIGSQNSERPVPIASVTKVMTAYIVLRDHPLRLGDRGPTIIVGPSDLADYQADRAVGDSVARVADGERITELQALQALLLPSADNIATLLARWDAGSEAAFVAKMNAEAQRLGLAQTHYADASGVDSATVSTAADQVRLAMLALRAPAFAQIVSMSQATLPVAGMEHNLDQLLGEYGIVGVKTGSTAAAGGCFVFAAHRLVVGRQVTVVGAVLGEPTGAPASILDPTFRATTAVLRSVPRVLQTLALDRDEVLGRITTPWTAGVAVRPAHAATLVGWSGMPVGIEIEWKRGLETPVRAGETVGLATLAAGEQRLSVPLVAARRVPKASVGWRLTHP